MSARPSPPSSARPFRTLAACDAERLFLAPQPTGARPHKRRWRRRHTRAFAFHRSLGRPAAVARRASSSPPTLLKHTNSRSANNFEARILRVAPSWSPPPLAIWPRCTARVARHSPLASTRAAAAAAVAAACSARVRNCGRAAPFEKSAQPVAEAMGEVRVLLALCVVG